MGGGAIDRRHPSVISHIIGPTLAEFPTVPVVDWPGAGDVD